jgi:hypothetical protein
LIGAADEADYVTVSASPQGRPLERSLIRVSRWEGFVLSSRWTFASVVLGLLGSAAAAEFVVSGSQVAH